MKGTAGNRPTRQMADEPQEIPSTISINGTDYDPIELQSFIDKGKQTLDLEKQWDTPVDQVWPKYGQTREQLNTLSQEKQALEAKVQQFEAKQNAGTDTATDLREAQAAARKLGIVLNEDLDKGGYIKKDDLPKYFESYSKQQEEVRKVLDKANELETTIDGKDGRPAFNKKVVLAYANAYNIADLEKAYEDMHKPQLDAWKSQQVNAQKPKGLKTLGTGGAKEPSETKVTDDNKNDLLKEALWGNS